MKKKENTKSISLPLFSKREKVVLSYYWGGVNRNIENIGNSLKNVDITTEKITIYGILLTLVYINELAIILKRHRAIEQVASYMYICKINVHFKIRKTIIQEFSFGNFRSFKNIQTLNLASAKIKSKYESIDESNIITDSKYKDASFLKSKAVYGANASGKSNIVKAFVTFIRIIRQSVKDEEILNLVEPFRLSTETENEPSFFQLIFWVGDVRYRYGFELDDTKIFAEWLYAKPGERELAYFIRENQEIIEIDKTNFSEGNKLVSLFDASSTDNEIFRNNSLFLSSISSLGFGKLSKQLTDNIASIFVINGLGHSGLFSYTGDSLSDEKRKKYIINFLKYSDTGIEDIDTFDIPSEGSSKESETENTNSEKDKKQSWLFRQEKNMMKI